MQALDAQEYKPILSGLFDKYIEATMAHCRHAFKVVVALPAVSQAMTVCKILEGILPRVRRPPAAGFFQTTGCACSTSCHILPSGNPKRWCTCVNDLLHDRCT